MTYDQFGWEFWIALFAAVVIVVIALSAEHGVYVVAYWQASVVGLAAIGIGIWRRRQWWLLLFSPIFLFPLGFGAMLLYGCGQGDCL